MKYKYAGLALSALVVSLMVMCRKPSPASIPPGDVLPQGVERIHVDTRDKLFTRQVADKIETRHGVREVTIVRGPEAEFTYNIKDYGYTFEPGLFLGWSDECRLGADARLLYFRQIGAGVGVSGVIRKPEWDTVRAHLFVDYTLGHNVGLFVGVDNKGKAIGGISWHG